MGTDESGAPWPYAPPVEIEEAGEPTWICPGGTCDCHPVEAEVERVDHTIFLFDPGIERMPNARVRVLENGRMINLDAPYASADGSVRVRIKPSTRHLFLEWAPQRVPLDPGLPHRSRYHVVLGRDTDEKVRLRLENLGFVDSRLLRGNVEDFERDYTTTEPPSGEPGSIAPLLVSYHDSGTIPPRGTKVSNPSSGGPVTSAQFAKKGDGVKRGDGGPPTTNPRQAPQGSAAPGLLSKVKINLAIVYDVDERDVDVPEKRTIEALADAAKILAEYRRERSPIAIEAATLVAFENEVEIAREPTDANGWATLDLKKASPNAQIKIVALPPDENVLPGTKKPSAKKKRLQLNPTNTPAGPSMPGADFSLLKMYRPFVLTLHLSDKRAPIATSDGLPDTTKIHLKPGKGPAPDANGNVEAKDVRGQGFINPKPKFVKLYQVSSEGLSKEGRAARLHIDWRPDWWKSENTDPRYALWNRFAANTRSVPASAPPAGIVVHHTHGVQMPGTAHTLVTEPKKNADGEPARPPTSIHYLIDLDGHTTKLVDESLMAFHAGSGQWDNFDAPNQFTVGFEIVHSDSSPVGTDKSAFDYAPREFFQQQYDSLIRICLELKAKYNISPASVIGHRDLKVLAAKYLPKGSYPNGGFSNRTCGGKPDCPGQSFQWEQLEDAGLALAPKEPKKLAGLSDELFKTPPALLSLGEPKAWTLDKRKDAIRLLQQLLFDIGYSVSASRKHPPRAEIPSDQVQLKAAGAAFQTHHFSGSRRSYNHEQHKLSAEKSKHPRTAALAKRPKIETIDSLTIQAIIRVWAARKQ